MKTTLLFIFLSLSPFANAEDLPPCDRQNWRDYKKGKCTLKNADLRGLDLRGQDLSGADLEGADFTGALLEGADFSNSKNIYKAKYDGARGTDRARGLILDEGRRLWIEETDKKMKERLKKRTEELRKEREEKKALEDKQKRDSEKLIRTLNRRLAKKIKDNEETFNISCQYVPVDPVYIKTKGCGGICSGVVKCKYLIDEPYFFSVAVTCESEGDDCPSANDCFEAKKPEKTFFVGTPAEYKEQYKTNKTDSDLIQAPSIKRPSPTKSGATQ